MLFKSVMLALALAGPALAGQRLYPRQGGGDQQSSLTLSQDLVQTASANDGQDDPVDGQVKSETSTNNFINYCGKFPGTPLTNGEQILEGSCNGIVMGRIPSKDKMPAQIIKSPKDGDVLEEGKDITFEIGVINLETGFFTSAQLTYYAAPQDLNDQGIIKGHSHITVQEIASLDSTEVQSIEKFAFFKGLNAPAVNGVLSATAAGGLKAGFFRACTMGSAANHQLTVQPVAQRASGDDCRRFEVRAGGANAGNVTGGGQQQNGGGQPQNGGGQPQNGGGQPQNGGGQPQNGGGKPQTGRGRVRTGGRGGRTGGRNGGRFGQRDDEAPAKRSNFARAPVAATRRSFSPAGRSRVARANNVAA